MSNIDLTNKRLDIKSESEKDDKPKKRKIKLDAKKYYLHRFASKINKPLYDMFICYGPDEFFSCRDDDIWLNFNAMKEYREEQE